MGADEPDKRFWPDASGRLTFELFHVPADEYPAVCKAVVDAFALTSEAPLVVGPDQLFGGWRLGEHAVGMAWDNWTGFTVYALTTGSETLTRDVAAWLCASSWAAASGSA